MPERRLLIASLLAFLAIGSIVRIVDLAYCRVVKLSDCNDSSTAISRAVDFAAGTILGILVKSSDP